MFTFNEMIDLAIRIERNGEKAYGKAQDEVLNADLIPVLRKLADDEKEHVMLDLAGIQGKTANIKNLDPWNP
jgi:rubrerythrin